MSLGIITTCYAPIVQGTKAFVRADLIVIGRLNR